MERLKYINFPILISMIVAYVLINDASIVTIASMIIAIISIIFINIIFALMEENRELKNKISRIERGL